MRFYSKRIPLQLNIPYCFRIFTSTLCAVTLMGVFTSSAHGQKISSHDQLLAGLFAGISGNFYSGNFDVFQGGTACGVFTNGTGWEPPFGILAEIPLSQKFSLSPRLLWNNLSGAFTTAAPNTGDVLVNGSPAPTNLQDKLATTLHNASLDALLKWMPFRKNNLYLLGGATFNYNTAASFTQTESILSPNNAVFTTNGQQDRTLDSGNFTTVNKLQYALSFGVGFDIPLSQKIFLAPEILTSIGLNSVLSDVGWNIITLRFMVAVKFDLTPEYVPPPPPIETEPQPLEHPLEPSEKAPKVISPVYNVPTAAFSLYGITPSGDQVPSPSLKVEEFVTTEFQPLLNYIFFDSASAAIPARYARLKKQETDNFSDTAILSSATFELYYNTLNFVGKRMQEYPASKLTITGCNSNDGIEENNTDLSQQRAEAVRNYLRDVWNLSPDRLTVKVLNLPDIPSRFGTGYGDEENRRVELWSDDDRVISPLTLSGLQRQVSVPKVRFYMHSSADSLIAKWRLDAKRNGNVINTIGGDGPMPPMYEMSLAALGDSLIKGTGTVQFTLTVQDSSGRKSADNASVKVDALTLKQKREQHIADKQVNKYRLFLFDFDQANLTAKNKAVISIINQEIKPTSTVTVFGFADRSGEAKHNLELSDDRAKIVADFIRAHSNPANIQSEGKGIDPTMFDNDLPEGRFFSRTVFVQVETPIEPEK